MSSLSLPYSPAAEPGRANRFDRQALRIAAAAVVLLPVALFYSRAVADGLIGLTAAAFLVSRAATGDRSWLRAAWTRTALLLWAWMVACSVIEAKTPAILQAVACARFFVFIIALEHWVLRDVRTRDALRMSVVAVTAWLLIEVWQQYLWGTNVFGDPRFLDGALTGPFHRPQAGSTYLALFFPALLPWFLSLTLRPEWRDWACALTLSAVATGTMILIGQRMPTVLLVFGLYVTGALFRQFRWPLLVTVALGAAMLALLPVVSPPTFAKLVVRFADQLGHFWATPYGMLFGRAVTMIQAHPWFGLGWDGFRNHCNDAAYLGGVKWLPVSDPASPEGCNIHPHNYWTQVATTAGLPGVALFAALIGLWLWRIAGGDAFRFNVQRGALLVALVVAMWPIASSTSLFTVPNAGWTFLAIGWGLAEARFGLPSIRRPVFSTPRYTSLLWPNFVP